MHYGCEAGGAFALESALYWAARSRGRVDVDPSYADLQRGFDGFPLVEADDRAVGNVPFFDDWLRHPEADAYWAAIDGRAARALSRRRCC